MSGSTRRGTSTRRLAFLLPLFVAAACSGAATTGSASSSTGTPSSTQAGTLITATVNGAGKHPAVTVVAPSSWALFDKGFAVTNDCCGVSFWDVGTVPRNPCHPIGHLSDPGPTVDDLAAALAKQQLRNATAPTDVTLGGYQGKYLEWSVPKRWVVTGDGDFKGCDVEDDGHRNFTSWEGNGGIGERWQQMAGQVDRLWILNVNGQRLVVDAAQSPDATSAQLDEQDQIVRSIRFVPTT
jgi:hypothetical protein